MIGRAMPVWVVAWTFLALPQTVCGAEPVRDVTWFLRRLRTVEHLAELEASHTAMSSTWDRTGGNADGTDFKAVSGFVTVRPGHPTVYSFHLNDAFQFQRNIRVVEEQMGFQNGEDLIRRTHPLWSSTAFWYALPAQASGSD